MKQISGVPELDAPIRGTAAGRKQVGLKRTPRQRLDRGLVRIQAVQMRAVAD